TIASYGVLRWGPNDQAWTFVGSVNTPAFIDYDTSPGWNAYGVYAVNHFGVKGGYTDTSFYFVGKTAPPSDVTSFTVQGKTLRWVGVSDLDLAGYVIRFHYGQNRSFGDAIPMHTG